MRVFYFIKFIIMKLAVYLGISLRLIALFLLAILGTYIPKFFPASFFDDYADNSGYVFYGVRHIWYNTLIILLFILSVINVFVAIRNLVLSHYPNTFK